MFIDRIEITAKAGRGGDGCVSFRREKYIPRGGPDGGNGGNGGCVILKARDKVPDLSSIRHKSTHKAEHGAPGGKARRQGRNGKDCVIFVPVGAMAWDADTGEFLGELLEPGALLTIAQGGRGGDGNVRFASPTNRVPQQCTPGAPGQERRVTLEFAIPADAALAGLPNSGKSTLLHALTNASPQIAAYPFTTTEPHIGVCEISPYARLTVLDLPALCEGASGGQGLGNWFLRHLHRARLILFVLDAAAAQSPAEQFRTLDRELRDAEIPLHEKKLLIAVNEKQPLTPDQSAEINALGIPWEALNPAKSNATAALKARLAELLDIE